MDPATAAQVAGVALQIARSAWDVGKSIHDFVQDVRNLDGTAIAFANEITALGTACDFVGKHVKGIIKKQGAETSRPDDVRELMSNLHRQLSGCKTTTEELKAAVACIGPGEVRDASVWKRISKQVQLKMKTRDVETARNRIRSHTGALQLTLQTIAMQVFSDITHVPELTWSSEIAYVMPNRVDAGLKLCLDEISSLRESLLQLRTARNTPDRSLESDEVNVLHVSRKVVSRAETLYSTSLHSGSVFGEQTLAKDRIIYDWILDANPSDSTEVTTAMSASDLPSTIFPPDNTRDSTHATTISLATHDRDQIPNDPEDDDALSTDADNEFDLRAIEMAVDEGRDEFKAHNYGEADLMLREALKMSKELPAKDQGKYDFRETRYMLGVCAFHLHEPSVAKDALLSIVELLPKDTTLDDARRRQVMDAGHLLAQIHIKLGELDAGRSMCESVLRGRCRLLGEAHEDCFESLALKARIIALQGNAPRARAFTAMIPKDLRDTYIQQFADLSMSHEQSTTSRASQISEQTPHTAPQEDVVVNATRRTSESKPLFSNFIRRVSVTTEHTAQSSTDLPVKSPHHVRDLSSAAAQMFYALLRGEATAVLKTDPSRWEEWISIAAEPRVASSKHKLEPTPITSYSGNATMLHAVAVNASRGDLDTQDQVELTESLIRGGADVNAPSNGGTPLILASRGQSLGLVDILLQRGAKVDGSVSNSGHTALMTAMRSRHDCQPILELLLSKKANVNAKDLHGSSVLMTAILYCKGLAILELLVANGADVNAKNFYGHTALNEAVQKNSSAYVEFLLEKGADIDAVDQHRHSALYHAHERNKLEMVTFLEAKGAKPLNRMTKLYLRLHREQCQS